MASATAPPANLTTTLSFNLLNPTDSAVSPSGPFELSYGQSLVITLSGFTAATSMNFLALRSKANRSSVVYFPDSAGTSTSTAFTVSANQSGSPLSAQGLVITITSNEQPDQDDYFDLTLHGAFISAVVPLLRLSLWSSDPEVINKAGSGGNV